MLYRPDILIDDREHHHAIVNEIKYTDDKTDLEKDPEDVSSQSRQAE